MAAGQDIHGRCICGGVLFDARIAEGHVQTCHCGMCQRWAAGPFMVVECEPRSVVLTGSENLAVYASSEWGERCFCKICGSALFWRLSDGSMIMASAGALDDKSGLELRVQLFVDEKPTYYAFSNDTEMVTGAEAMATMTKAET